MPLLTSRWVSWGRPPTRAQKAWAEGLGGERERALGRGLCEVTEWSPSPPGRQGCGPGGAWRGREPGVWPWGGAGPGAGIGGTRACGRWPGLQGNLTLLHPERCRVQAGRRGCAALAAVLRGPCAVGENSELRCGTVRGMSGGIPEVRGGGRREPARGPHAPWARTAVLPGRGGEEVWGPTCVRGCFMCGLAWGPCPRRPVSRAPRGEEGPAVCGPKRGPNLRSREGGPGCLPWFQGRPRALEGVSLGRGGTGVAFQQDPGVHRVRVGVLVSLRRAVLSAVLASARNPEAECGSLTLLPGSEERHGISLSLGPT